MTLLQDFQNQMSAHSGAGVVGAQATPRFLTCELTELTPIAVSFDSLVLKSSELARSSVDELRAISQSLANRVTYLLEPIGPIEIDGDQCVVQMRSIPPSKSDTGHTYYELLVERGGSLALARYEAAPGGPRQRIEATVTREVLMRLVSDFCAALDESSTA